MTDQDFTGLLNRISVCHGIWDELFGLAGEVVDLIDQVTNQGFKDPMNSVASRSTSWQTLMTTDTEADTMPSDTLSFRDRQAAMRAYGSAALTTLVEGPVKLKAALAAECRNREPGTTRCFDRVGAGLMPTEIATTISGPKVPVPELVDSTCASARELSQVSRRIAAGVWAVSQKIKDGAILCKVIGAQA
jgi:hypothetical protein